ncbi:histidinol dehydrogenase [Streptomyces sp. NPDC058157]|uniref:histidinol dehydrogenase n=1 Tax=Streptomyces sp. NPDC058157 TaxID=3346360 RepID=UPI0036EE0AB2
MTDSPSALVLDWATASPEARKRFSRPVRPAAGSPADDALLDGIRQLIEDVRTRGDSALLQALKQFDGIDLSPRHIRVEAAEFAAAREALDPATTEAIRVAIAQVRAFSEKERGHASWQERGDGTLLGVTAKPLDSVGLFVPCGKGSFPSVLVQIATPAVVAGVPRIAVAVPPVAGTPGQVDPAVLVAAQELGIDEVYRVNGPAGIAALAYGTETVPRVDKIVGPGSPAVALAQREVQRSGCLVEVGYGPSDSLIVCDGQARPDLLAADLLNEAEHGPDSSAVLVGTDASVLARAAEEVARQMALLPEPRRRYAHSSLHDNGGIVLVPSLSEAMDIANDYAPEHLQLAVAEPESLLPLVRHAGTVLLGQWTTFAASNFAIGTPATLPTAGFARITSGVTTATYMKRIAIAALDRNAFERIAPAVKTLAVHEGFPAHAASVTIRQEGS